MSAMARSTRAGADQTVLFVRAIDDDARRAGCAVTLARVSTTMWVRSPFVGARHVVSVEVSDTPDLDAWIDALSADGFPGSSLRVADLMVKDVTRRAGIALVTIEALTVGNRNRAAGYRPPIALVPH